MPVVLQHTVRRPSGYLFISGPDGIEEGETLSCVHCQYLWRVEPGSGRRRGFCMRCNGPTCGKRVCTEVCLPWERACELLESRRLLDLSLERIKAL